MVRAVIFDYFGVLASDEFFESLAGDDKNIVELSREVNLGQLHWQDFLQRLAAETGKTTTEVTEAYERQRLNPEMVALAARLHDNYKTAILSNASAEFLQPVVMQAHLDRVFDAIVMSSEVGHAKPEAEIYELAASRLEVKLTQCIFTDDRPDFCQAAEALGMQAITYQNFVQFQRNLKAILD
jgi:putative hydrolase of the HAD superfamily